MLNEIQAFLAIQAHAGPDLLARWSPDLETQVNVAAGSGEPVDGIANCWTKDGTYRWHNVRIPKDAATEPHFEDRPLGFPLDLHAEAIGTTGWDWVARRSRWLGFDFDAITGHAAGVGVSDDALEAVRQAACSIPWVEVRRSSSGNGLHLWVPVDVPTENHTEHAALGRAVLGLMSAEVGFDFGSQIDACGSNMWIWRRNHGPNGFELLKAAEGMPPVPLNWKDHIPVVTRQRSKVRIEGVTDEALTGLASRKSIPLDETHRRIINALCETGFSAVWVPDHHLLQTHTKALENVHREQRLRGLFFTIAAGDDPKPNCFCFPLPNGAWKVCRFSPGVAEHESWTQDGAGFTTCYYNRSPSLEAVVQMAGGVEMENGGYQFAEARQAAEAAALLEQPVDVPEHLVTREAKLSTNSEGKLVVKIKALKDEKPTKGWSVEKGWFIKVSKQSIQPDAETVDCDDMIRYLIALDQRKAGWKYKDDTGRWVESVADDLKMSLRARGLNQNEVTLAMGVAVNNPWTIVNLPFQPEFPGDRRWNIKAPQYVYAPAEVDEPCHPHWNMVINHCFRGLDTAISSLEWCQKYNIKRGADYGLAWIACLLREPFFHLPYLFLHSREECTGKSTLHEAIELLLSKGSVVSADRALTNTGEFNGELTGAILAYIEEKNVSKAPGAHARIKDWVTNPTLWLHRKRMEPFGQPNMLHFVQCANDQGACPIIPGDTRITMIHVRPFEKEVPKAVLFENLQQEAPHFMTTIMRLTLPPVMGRLRLPVIDTADKQNAAEKSRNSLDAFIIEMCFSAPGYLISFDEFRDKFMEFLPSEERPNWTARTISKALPPEYPTARKAGNKTYIANLSWEAPTEVRPTLVCLNRKFVEVK